MSAYETSTRLGTAKSTGYKMNYSPSRALVSMHDILQSRLEASQQSRLLTFTCIIQSFVSQKYMGFPLTETFPRVSLL